MLGTKFHNPETWRCFVSHLTRQITAAEPLPVFCM